MTTHFTRRQFMSDLAPIPDSRLRELATRFDVVLGVSPLDEPKAG